MTSPLSEKAKVLTVASRPLSLPITSFFLFSELTGAQRTFIDCPECTWTSGHIHWILPPGASRKEPPGLVLPWSAWLTLSPLWLLLKGPLQKGPFCPLTCP